MKHFISLILLCFPLISFAWGQSIQISTHFKTITGNPSWLLEIREMQTQEVTPYLFDITDSENFWLAFTKTNSYRITASTLKFGPFAKIKNFCGLENGIITDKSMSVILSGDLSPDPTRIKCKVFKYPGNLAPTSQST